MKFAFHCAFAHLALDPAETRVSGGAELQAALLARALVERGHECLLIGGEHGQPETRWLQGVKCRTGGRFQTGGLLDTARALPASFRVLAEERPDYTFIYGWTTWLFFLLRARARGHTRRLGFTCMLDTEVNGEFRRENPARGAFFEYGLHQADVRYAITDYQVECFTRMGLSSTLYRPLIMPRAAPLGAPKEIDLLWIARCQAIKRPHLFLDLAAAFPRARCTMVAPREDIALWESVAARAGTLPNVTFLERVPYHQVQAYYDRAEIFVNTSTWEGFANSFIQAGQGRAALLSLVVNTDQLLTRFEAGLCAGDDQALFHRQAARLLEDSALRQRCQAGSARFVAEWHDNDRNLDAFLAGLPA